MNLLKRSPPPPPPPPQLPPHSASATGLDIGRTVTCSIGGMGGENSAFRAVVTTPSTINDRLDSHTNTRQQTERKPSAFRMISQLVGDDTTTNVTTASSTSPCSERRSSHLAGHPNMDIDSVDDEDEEIDVQDSDQEVVSSSPLAWRDHWSDQQPLELTKHDR